MKNPIYPCLWFDGNAKAAAEYYCEVFPNSKILSENPMVVTFELNGRKFMGLNGGPKFKFNESVSFVIDCETQEEVDYYWGKLTAGGGEEGMCGWLKDKFGVSWQVIPTALGEFIGGPDREKADRAVKAMLQMKKLDIEALRKAYEGEQ